MPDQADLPRHIADCMKRAGAELSEDQYMLLAGYLAQTQSELTAAKAEIERLRGRVAELEQAVVDSQDWNWISAKEYAEDHGHDFFDIEEMQRLHQISKGKNSGSFILRKQAEAIESFVDEYRGRISATRALKKTQRLRQQAEAAEKGGDDV